jgi:hypothetical protein
LSEAVLMAALRQGMLDVATGLTLSLDELAATLE